MYLIVGLGNPGTEYRCTRHNAGFMVVDRVAAVLNATFEPGKGDYLAATVTYKCWQVVLAKPLTFMNASGVAVEELVQHYQIALSQLLIVCDDINLPLGKLRLRARGSDGGHRGMASIIYHLKSTDFPRLRLGIGHHFEKHQIVDYVLSEFQPHEREVLGTMIERAKDAVLSFVERGIEVAMNECNPDP